MEIKTVEIKQDMVTGYWFSFINQREATKAKTLVKCLKSLAAYVKSQS